MDWDEVFKEVEVPEDVFGPSVRTITEVNAKMDECYAILEKHFGVKLSRPTVRYDLEGHVAGYALIRENAIRLNLHLISTHRDDMINNTLPHEIAHIVTYQIYPSATAHGRHWASVMWVLGLPADRCHTYETKAARVRKREYHYECGCPEGHLVTKTIHNRIQQGRMYTCRKCHTRLR
jgi:SprT protein